MGGSGLENPEGKNKDSFVRYPQPVANYSDVISDQDLFFHSLEKLHLDMNTTYTVPSIGGAKLDLHKLFKEVTSRGGIVKVIGDGKWKEITELFTFSSTATDVTTVMKKYYNSLMYHYEQVYFFKTPGYDNTDQLPRSPTRSQQVKVVSPTVHCKRKIVDGSGSSGHPQKMPMKMGMTSRVDDPDYPKRPPNGYGLFFSEQMSQHSDKDGDIKTAMFERWNNLTQSEKDVYLERGRQAKERYEREVASYEETKAKESSKSTEGGGKTSEGDKSIYIASGSGSSKPPKKMPRKTWMTTKIDDPDYPKGPRTGYNIFFSEQASQHSNEDGDIRTKMAARWKSLSDTEKAVYQEKGRQEREKYEIEVASYEETKAKESSKSTEGGGKTSEGTNALVEVPNEGMGKGDLQMGEASNNPVEGESSS